MMMVLKWKVVTTTNDECRKKQGKCRWFLLPVCQRKATVIDILEEQNYLNWKRKE